MSYYFLVEGRRSERKLYPSWLSYIAPQYRRIEDPSEAEDNTYYLISAEGYPSIIGQHLQNAIADIENSGKFKCLIVVLDSEESSVDARRAEVFNAANKLDTPLKSATLEVVVQNRCIETWLLGNSRVVARKPQGTELRDFIAFYDVVINDPELSPLRAGFASYGQYYHSYLQAIFRERGLSYTKHNPGHAKDEAYLSQLKSRAELGHIKSFGQFLQLCSKLF
ncbi:MAG TPA: hypothetical protein PKE26_16570 [Kiritimatiellia bacterium]|nr:hypothetical protein [Kiritimatiellia bacterium]HMP00711.1 hypothetical protein [Kiritimatiellia bacterium]